MSYKANSISEKAIKIAEEQAASNDPDIFVELHPFSMEDNLSTSTPPTDSVAISFSHIGGEKLTNFDVKSFSLLTVSTFNTITKKHQKTTFKIEGIFEHDIKQNLSTGELGRIRAFWGKAQINDVVTKFSNYFHANNDTLSYVEWSHYIKLKYRGFSQKSYEKDFYIDESLTKLVKIPFGKSCDIPLANTYIFADIPIEEILEKATYPQN